MIVRPYIEPTGSRSKCERAGDAAEEQMAHYLHTKFHDDPEVCVLHQLRFEDADQPKRDGSPGVCQIDHLVVHRWGFFLVESKSVMEEVRVRSDGDGGDEWSRTYRGKQKGMPSPIRQARRQSEFLRALLERHRSELLGRFRLGFRTIAKIRGDGDQRGFRFAPMQLVVAVSDNGRIRRLDGWKAPEKPFRVIVKKADLVPEAIERELDRHRVGANLLHVKPVGEYGAWSMEAEEISEVAKFLAGPHVDPSADSSTAANHGKTWSPEDSRELLRLHEDGWDNVKLAKQFGRTPKAITYQLGRLAG